MVGRLALRVIAAFLVSLLHLVLAPAAFGQQSILSTDQAFQLRATRTAPDALRLNWKIRPGYYLYRDKFAVKDAGNETIAIVTPVGITKDDPNFGTTEIYLDQVEIALSGAGLEASGGRSIAITYQGCQDGGICYLPVTKRLDLSSLAIQGDSLAQKAAQLDATVEWKQSPDATAPSSSITLAGDSAGGLVSSMLSEGGVLLLLGSFLLFGLALAFTPCVFPMYPILAGILAGSGEALSPGRGFRLSAVYVLAMASAFGLLGIAAAWSGTNLQIALQSPVAILAVSVLFVALALSMFGLYELRMPTRWVNAIGGKGANARGSARSAALLGLTSALVIGPCVTAPLAGALLYIGQTGDVTIGAAALFALGIGKGIPLIIFGTFGATALPKAGAWMETVKRAFGLVFLAAAVSLISRIIPDHYALALWALLLIGASVYLGAFDTLTADASGRQRTAKTAGLIAGLYGVLLAVGAAAGAGDPLRPLAPLVQRATPTAVPAFARVQNLDDMNRRIATADGRASLVYFTADWCVTCATIERNVLPDPAIRARLAGFNLIKADVTNNGAEQQHLMQSLRVVGPPTMIMVDADGREVSGARLVGDVTVETLLAAAEKAKTTP